MARMMAVKEVGKKEVLRLLRVVMKTANAALDDDVECGGSGAEESRCLDALSTLKSFPVTYELFASSEVQRYLTVLRTHPIKNIKVHVRDVIDTWKRRVFKEPKQGDVVNEKKTKVRILLRKKVDPAPVINAKPISVVAVSNKKAESLIKKVDIEKQPSSKIDQDPPSCTDALRDKIRGLLYKGLCGVFDDDQVLKEDMKERVSASNPVEIATSLESALFAEWGHATGSSSIKYRSVLFNIKDPKNPDFRRKLLVGDMKAESVVSMSTEEMASDERQREYQHIKAKAVLNSMTGTNRKGTTDAFKCGRCGKSETTYYQMQTRSADEPMTTYFTCVNCDYHWKES